MDSLSAGGPQQTALVADDDPATLLLLCRAMERAGLRVVQACDGEEAVAQFERTRPDIVLLDVMMPRLDGFEVCRRIRGSRFGTRIPILMLTGLDDIESIHRAYDAGASDFITKPMQWAILGHRVRYMLRGNRALEELAESRASLAAAQRIAKVGSWDWDLVCGAGRWSAEMYRMIGLPSGARAPGWRVLLKRVHVDDRRTFMEAIRDATQDVAPLSIDLRLGGDSEGAMIVHAEAETVRDEAGRAARLRGTLQDITERRQAEARIHTLACFDSLTGLPNRAHFLDQLKQAISGRERRGGFAVVMCLDIDHLKRINDTAGYKAGDRVLQIIAARLASDVRAEDPVARGGGVDPGRCASRFGGDQFSLMMADLADASAASDIARRILDTVSVPFDLDGRELRITASIGIAIAPLDGDDADQLLINADAAMYHAKDSGRNGYQFYNREMNASAAEALLLETELRKALERGDLFLQYQPQVDAVSGHMVGVEALTRWQHAELGMIPPGKFIPLAERTGLIIPLSEWVLETACRQNRAWQADGLRAIPVAVNISSPHFRQPGFIETVAGTLTRTGLEAHHLELEITEGILIRDVERTLDSLRALKAMGVLLAIDDFGTGFSSLSYLKRFPIDLIKIDRSFVHDIVTQPNDLAITSAIIGMGRGLRVSVIAEGVETVEQSDLLRAQGCRLMQGFLFSRPTGPAEIAAMLRSEGRDWPAPDAYSEIAASRVPGPPVWQSSRLDLFVP